MDEYYAKHGGKDDTYETLDTANQPNTESEEKQSDQDPSSATYVHGKDDLGQLEVCVY